MAPKVPTRDALLRYAEVANHYRRAFKSVQDALAAVELGRVPPWVFAVERLTREELNAIAPALAEAETQRRAWRAALHAITELIALEDAGEAGLPPARNEAEVRTLFDSLDGDMRNQRKLDRFISVINGARAGSCIYINGTFRPTGFRDPDPPTPTTTEAADDEATVHLWHGPEGT
ncbi:MAG: hypothetical protein ACI8PZ_004875 [Myxococcota bacterium]|jgi:hypothetical protein